MQRAAYETTEFGTGWIMIDGDDLVEVILPGEAQPEAEDASPDSMRNIIDSLEEYYAGRAVCVPRADLSESAGNTEFQKAIYHVVSQIRPGETMSYGEVAFAAGRPKAARAVGAAMARNPFAPFIPCHRVVASNGGLGGYGGGLDMKAKMLDMEREGVEAAPGSA